MARGTKKTKLESEQKGSDDVSSFNESKGSMYIDYESNDRTKNTFSF